MTLKQFAGVDGLLRDNETKRQISYEEYLHRVVTRLGTERVKLCIPFSERELKEAYIRNSNFSTLHDHFWSQTEIATLFLEAGITSFSLEDRLAVLKYAAKLICKEMNSYEPT